MAHARRRPATGFGVIVALLVLAACDARPGPDAWRPTLPARPATPVAPEAAQPARVTRIATPGPAGLRVRLGRDELPEPASPAPAVADGDPVTLNLRDVTLPEMAEKILGDILGEAFTVETDLPGTLSLTTPRPVGRRELVRLFEDMLTARGAVLVRGDGVWRIVAADAAGPALAAAPPAEGLAGELGYGTRTVRLRNIGAAQMAEILRPLSPEGTIRSLDEARGLLVLAGPQGLLDDLMRTVSVFDVDWLRQMSVALVPLRQADPARVAEELTFAIASDAEARRTDTRVMPVARARAVLIVSPSASILRTVQEMVPFLDVGGREDPRQIFVYEVQNRSAAELAGLLSGVFGGGQGPASVPGLVEASAPASADGLPDAGIVPAVAPATVPAAVSVTADDAANALILRADPGLAEQALQVIRRLDTPPDQVLLEVTIAEVTLSDELRYGLEWYLRFGDFQGQLSNSILSQPINALAPAAPGLSLLLSGTNATVILNALARVTDVNVVSTPSLMVIDNREARLQVGDQVPVVTQSAVSVSDPDAPIVNQVAYRDTGVTMVVTPRISESGQVLLTIQQDVSDVVETTTSGIDSPTIRQRQIATTVSVADGESLALGGLIRDQGGHTENGIPLLKDIPVAGELFRTTGNTRARTELLVLITPRIVRDRTAAREVTAELRERLVALRPAGP
jgi:general secretion pathway protein D